jgi:hypothetical protein
MWIAIRFWRMHPAAAASSNSRLTIEPNRPSAQW